MGRPLAIASITTASIVASLLLTYLSLLITPTLPESWPTILIIAVVISAVVSTVVGGTVVRILFDLEEARRMVQELARTDGLTGIHNRRYFMDLAEVEFGKTLRHRLDMAVLMFDADHFKKINDVYGHAVGDAVLRGIARAAADSLREGDILARYGGEEFVALLPLTTAAAAMKVAERVRAAVAAMRVEAGNDTFVRVTVSIGVGSFASRQTALGALLNEADQALYRAKAAGRDRVVRFEHVVLKAAS